MEVNIKEVARVEYRQLCQIVKNLKFEDAYEVLGGYNKGDNYFDVNFCHIGATILKHFDGNCIVGRYVDIWDDRFISPINCHYDSMNWVRIVKEVV